MTKPIAINIKPLYEDNFRRFAVAVCTISLHQIESETNAFLGLHEKLTAVLRMRQREEQRGRERGGVYLKKKQAIVYMCSFKQTARINFCARICDRNAIFTYLLFTNSKSALPLLHLYLIVFVLEMSLALQSQVHSDT